VGDGKGIPADQKKKIFEHRFGATNGFNYF
jgi:signal transduction histidine kinase